MNNVTVGVYASGNFKTNIVKPEHLEHHLRYNKELRPGRALFLNGTCVQQGYLSDEEVKVWEEKIEGMTFNRSVSSQPYQ
jgi:hypothetical protein